MPDKKATTSAPSRAGSALPSTDTSPLVSRRGTPDPQTVVKRKAGPTTLTPDTAAAGHHKKAKREGGGPDFRAEIIEIFRTATGPITTRDLFLRFKPVFKDQPALKDVFAATVKSLVKKKGETGELGLKAGIE